MVHIDVIYLYNSIFIHTMFIFHYAYIFYRHKEKFRKYELSCTMVCMRGGIMGAFICILCVSMFEVFSQWVYTAFIIEKTHIFSFGKIWGTSTKKFRRDFRV